MCEVRVFQTMFLRGIIIFLIAMLFQGMLSAQARTGIKGGISTFDLAASDIIIEDEGGISKYQLGINKTKVGVHIGFFVQAVFRPFFIQPELMFNSNTISYRFTDLQDIDAPVEIRDENYQTLDFPLILGFKFGPVRIGGGPIGHLFLNSNSDINDLFGEDYEANFNAVSWGWQAGIGVDIWQLHLDVRYEGNFKNFGRHMNYYGVQYEFDAKPSRFLASVGISF